MAAAQAPGGIAERRVRVFEQRYGWQAAQLAAHAAFPLTLTTDVVYCLRESFLPDCPWYAAADVLLSGLCVPVGHDLYEMEMPTRHYLLRDLKEQFGEEHVHKVADFMAVYLRRRLQGAVPDQRVLMLGEKPQWTALACLRPGEAFEEIKQALHQLAQGTMNQDEQFRMASLVESYGDFLAEQGYRPILLDWADRVAEGEPVDESAEVAAQLQAVGFTARWVEFEVTTVVVGTEPLDSEPANDNDLKFDTVETVRVNDRGQVVKQDTHSVRFFEEKLGADKVPLRMVAIPSGEFLMGTDDEEGRWKDEGPQHPVKVSPFFMGQYPVTQAQWQAVVALPKADLEADLEEDSEEDLNPDPSRFKGGDRPVEQVSWHEAVAFCARLSRYTGRTYRLPTEAEWEYACRADTTTPFYFGETLTTDLANYNGNVFLNEPKGKRREETTAVGQFKPNPFGLYDMHGNVWEWCMDHWHDDYTDALSDGRAWLENTPQSNKGRVRRGGSWFSDPRYCRSACRANINPDYRDYLFGFRVVCEARGL